ncbi:MAG: 50S ribosomal protein L23 [Eubacteriales bacterium]
MKTSADIIRRPLITEKSMDGIKSKVYSFEVDKRATKPEIAKAVEEMFDVKVKQVNTLHVKKKPKRLGAHAGYTTAWKKAIVTLTEESGTIAFFDGMN